MQNYINSLIEIQEQLERDFNFSCPVHIKIVISKRLRSSNGSAQWRFHPLTRDILEAKITMSYALLEEFGWEQFEKTFRHEMAHIVNYLWHGKTRLFIRGRWRFGGCGHDLNFKRICKDFGGSMNKNFARNGFEKCATNKFVKTIKKWSYTCPCGHVKKTAKRMSVKKRTLATHVCRTCRTYTNQWIERKIA
jgi:predicted SprT family Zn-dependent metalloprotease